MNQVKIYDTTLRDGTQGMGISFSLDDKVRIARALDELGIHYIEGGWPGSNPKDSAFFEITKRKSFKNAKIVAFSSTKKPGVKITDDPNISSLVRTGTPVFTIFGKSSAFQVEHILDVSLNENLDMIYETITYLKKYTNEIIYDAEHFFDGYKANPEYAIKTILTAQNAGADVIVLCDTNGGAVWYELEDIIDKVKKETTTPLGIHCHNDSDMAVINSLTAVRKGIIQVQGTINGIGERCGNANLCSIIPNLFFKMNIESVSENNIKMLTSISRLVSELSNQQPLPNLPYVGDNAFAHKGGVHVSAVKKKTGSYEYIQPEKVGNQRKVLEKFYPNLKKVKLTDYKVRILNEQAGTKATTRVLINFSDGKRIWTTVGVSNNILEASWITLTDAFKYKLMKDDEMRTKRRIKNE